MCTTQATVGGSVGGTATRIRAARQRNRGSIPSSSDRFFSSTELHLTRRRICLPANWTYI
jgi:hypothetical protein